MSEVYVNGERKRRLPLWMTTSAGVPDQVDKSRSKDDENIALKPKVKRVAKRVEKEIDGKDTLEVDSRLLVKDEAKKRVKKTRRQELDHDNDPVNSEEGLPKKRTKKGVDVIKRKAKDSTLPKKRNQKSIGFGSGEESKDPSTSEDDEEYHDPVNSEEGLPKKRTKKGVDVIKSKTKDSTLPKKRNQKSIGLGSGEETKDPSTSDDDEELTVEDLVSIAEEYVEADKRKGHQKQAIKEHESAQLPAVSDFSRNETVGSIGDAQSSRILPADITMGPSSTNDMIRSQNQVSSASNPSQTGDPAQDMLALFLGPLLKMPQTEARKPEFITHDIALESEFRKHSGDGISGEKVVTLTKKKSSLKDRVAMFF